MADELPSLGLAPLCGVYGSEAVRSTGSAWKYRPVAFNSFFSALVCWGVYRAIGIGAGMQFPL